MIKNILLNSAMSANLHSLRDISRQMDKTQEVLSSGLKVNSAIDNASSYYQARGLNNRAADLNSLLDAMGQGIQTINAAVEGIGNGLKYLEQAKVVLNQAQQLPEDEINPDVPGTAEEISSKQGFELMMSDYGIGGVVVSNKADLIKALEDAKAGGEKNIVVWGSVDMGNTIVALDDGVKLIAGETIIRDNGLQNDFYVGDNGQASLSFNNNGGFNSGNAAIIAGAGSVLSDLSLHYSSYSKQALIYIDKKEATLNNLDVHIDSIATTGMVLGVVELSNSADSKVKMTGHNEIALQGNNVSWNAVHGGWNSVFELEETATLVIENINPTNGGNNVIRGMMELYNITSLATNPSNFEIYGTINAFLSDKANVIYGSTSEVKMRTGGALNLIDEKGINPLLVADGRKLTAEAGAVITYTNLINDTTTVWSAHKAGTVTGPIDLSSTTLDKYSDLWQVSVGPAEDFSVKGVMDSRKNSGVSNAKMLIYKKEYDAILKQYDKLIKDASYGGVNLLAEDSLKIKFNTSGRSFFSVDGADASAKALGIRNKNWLIWENLAEIEFQMTSAISQMRNISSDFSNMYSIVTTRENFTENMNDVLTEGADKLILADMNEASAQYLMLEVRQSLAVNALSLAAQSSRSVLQIF